MDSFLFTLLCVFAIAMYGVNRLFLWLQRRGHKKLKAERYRSKCSYPCTPCSCDPEAKDCSDADVCAGK